MDDFDFDVLTGPSGPDCRACRPIKQQPAERTPAKPAPPETAAEAARPPDR